MRFFSPLLLALSLFLSPAIADEQVAHVTKVNGLATALRDSTLLTLAKSNQIVWKDIIETKDNTRLEIIFRDKTLLQMGDNSKLTIDEMVYEADKKGQALFTFSQGVFRMVSGAINKVKGGTLTIQTPIATIGVRGTDFWGQQTDQKLFMALLDNGILEITTPSGSVTLTEPRSAVTIEAGKAIGPIFTLSIDEIKNAKKTVQ